MWEREVPGARQSCYHPTRDREADPPDRVGPAAGPLVSTPWPPDNIAAVKRQLSGAVVALAVVVTGSLASACDITPPAASSNGATISTASLNTQLRTLETTAAGGCLLQLENSQLAATSGQGAGGPGTYTMTFANAVLNNQVGDLLAEQFAASKGITVSSADLATAKSDFQSTLDGEISCRGATGSTSGAPSRSARTPPGPASPGKPCWPTCPVGSPGPRSATRPWTRSCWPREPTSPLPPWPRTTTPTSRQFTPACVSLIATDTQAHADQLVAQINGGASFADVAKANSLDSQTAANGGALGLQLHPAQVEQALQVQSVTAGTPIAPVQDSSTGEWIIYEMTSQTVEPLSAAARWPAGSSCSPRPT